jgi:hypothetical protein
MRGRREDGSQLTRCPVSGSTAFVVSNIRAQKEKATPQGISVVLGLLLNRRSRNLSS